MFPIGDTYLVVELLSLFIYMTFHRIDNRNNQLNETIIINTLQDLFYNAFGRSKSIIISSNHTNPESFHMTCTLEKPMTPSLS